MDLQAGVVVVTLEQVTEAPPHSPCSHTHTDTHTYACARTDLFFFFSQ